MHKTAGMRLNSGKTTPAQKQVHRHIIGNPPRKPLDSAGIRQKAPLHFGQLKEGGLGCKDKITGEGKLKATTHGRTIYQSDDWLQQIMEFNNSSKAARTVTGLRMPVKRRIEPGLGNFF